MDMSMNNDHRETGRNVELFLRTMYGTDAPGYLSLWRKDTKQSYHIPAFELCKVTGVAGTIAPKTDVYFGLGLREKDLGPDKRGKATDVVAIPAVWIDIDIAGSAHKRSDLPSDMEAAQDLLASFPLRPSILVNSGHGLHVYWLLHSLWILETPEDREKAAHLVSRVQAMLRREAHKRGWELDNTSDLARVLRLPGTLNHKSPEDIRPVEIVELHDRRYSLEDFEANLTTTPQEFADESLADSRENYDGPPASAEKILSECAFMRHCRDDAATLSEPEWYSMITNVSRTDGGVELVHELSKPYPGYSYEETAQKIVHGLSDTGPHTCRKIEELTNGQWCRLCPYRGKVRSPIVLGMPRKSNCTDHVEAFPVEVFPEPLRQFINEGAQALPCPPDFLGVPLLTMLSTAIGTNRVLQIKPGWEEYPVIYAAVVAKPGDKKSPALKLASIPFKERQKYFQEQYEFEMQAYIEEKAAYDEAPKDEKPEKPHKPIMRQVFTTDSTIEALALLLEKNPNGILFLQDELTSWVLMMNRYRGGKGADRQFFLSSWNCSPIAVNRKCAEEPIILPKPFVGVIGCLPPDVVGDLCDERGREDGFINRILFAYPEPVPMQWTDAGVSSSALNELRQVFQRLWQLVPSFDAQGNQIPVTFTPEGKEVWVNWINGHHQEQQDPDFPENLRGPWAKLEGYTARLALIIHTVRYVCGEVSEENVDQHSVAGAVSLTNYFKNHIKRVYALLQTTPQDKRVNAVVAWIRRHGDTATPRDLYRHGVAGVKTASEAKKLLRHLVDRGLGQLKKRGTKRGRPSLQFTLFADALSQP